jgi:hypothetical protein
MFLSALGSRLSGNCVRTGARASVSNMKVDPRERQMRQCWPLVVMLLATACQPPGAVRRSPPAALRPQLTFVPQSDSFAAAAREYERLWAAEGERIVRAMEAVSGLTSRDTAVTVIVFEGISTSGYRDVTPMRMRASYPPDTKKATLIHELGHRLQSGFFRRDEEEHGPLFLWLYDTWVQLYGREFADAGRSREASTRALS